MTKLIDICLILSTFSFIPVNDCVGMGPSGLLFPGAYYAIKTALGRRSMKVSLENECLAVLGQRWKILGVFGDFFL